MSTTEKRPIAQMLPVAQGIVGSLKPYCERVEIAGSIRRGKAMVGDIEIVAIPRGVQVDLFGNIDIDVPTDIDRYLQGIASYITVHKNGAKFKQFSFIVDGGSSYTVDLFLQPDPATWGVNFMIRTGSEKFSKRMVTAQRFGGYCPDDLRFSKARIWRGDEALYTPEEVDVFKALGLEWVEPEERSI